MVIFHSYVSLPDGIYIEQSNILMKYPVCRDSGRFQSVSIHHFTTEKHQRTIPQISPFIHDLYPMIDGYIPMFHGYIPIKTDPAQTHP